VFGFLLKVRGKTNALWFRAAAGALLTGSADCFIESINKSHSH
jgi:hypothetical protein